MTVLALAALLGGCAVGPDYVRPAMDLPQAYKEQGPWKVAAPRLADDRQRWWEAYGDPILNDLVTQANAANQTIQQAAAQYRQAQATAAVARASLWPTVGAQAGATRAQTNTNGVQRLADNYTVGLNASGAASAVVPRPATPTPKPVPPAWPLPGWRSRPRWRRTTCSCA